MSLRGRLRKIGALSFSMPDVTGAGYSASPGSFAPTQEIVEEEEEEVDQRSEVDAAMGDRWLEAVDPTSGSLFYVDSAPRPCSHHNGSALIPSSSSSSLSSSTTSLSHSRPPFLTPSPLPRHKSPISTSTSLPPTPQESIFPPLPLRSITPHVPSQLHACSMSELPHSPVPSSPAPVLSSPAPSEDSLRFFPSEMVVPEALMERPFPTPSPSPSEGRIPKSHSTSSVGRSVRKTWRKMVKGGRRRKESSLQPNFSHGMVPSGSFPDLNRDAGYFSRHDYDQVSYDSPQPPAPHGALYGSRGFAFAPDAHASIISVRISLRQHPQTGRSHRHWNLEKLGIVPARALKGSRYGSFTNLRLSFKNHYPSSPSSPTNALVVRGIIPGSPASFTTQLQPGDTVLAVNGHSVSLDNANSVVRSHSDDDEVVLIVKKNSLRGSALTSTPAHHHLHTSSHRSGLVGLVSGKARHHSHSSPPHLLLYLTLDTNENDPVDKDILYCYPKEAHTPERGREEEGKGRGEEGKGREELWRLLVQLRGVFLTLSDVMASVTMTTKSCSTVKVRGQQFHLAHVQFHKEVLLLAVPATILPRHLVLEAVEGIVKTLQLMFGSPHEAFTSPDHHSTVDHLMFLLLHSFLPHSHSSQPHSSHSHTITSSLITSFSMVPRHVLPVETAVRVSEVLDTLEAVSPTHRMTDIAHAPRTLLPRGSVLFHKGRLVLSHLSPGELMGVASFCQTYRLLEISSQDPRASIVIWRELRLTDSGPNLDDGNIGGRVFLLLVGLNHVIIGLVMEGCGLTSEATPTIDPVYVNEAKLLIAELQAQEIFQTSARRGSTETLIPAVTSLDRVLASHLSTPHKSPQIARRLSLQHHNTACTSDTDEEEEEESGSSRTSRSMTMPSFLPRGKRKESVTAQDPQGSLLTGFTIRQNYTLTAGVDNILLHYLCLEVGQGVWLSPAHKEPPPYGTVHSEMITCFQATCAAIRKALLGKADAEEEEESDDEWDWGSEEEGEEREQEAKPSSPPFSQLLPGGRCVEHGVLLEVPLKYFVPEKQLKTTPPLCYWVVGRLFPDSGREFYVCHLESTSQTMIELAFKLLFATSSS